MMSRHQRVLVYATAVLVGLALAGGIVLVRGYVEDRRETDERLDRQTTILLDCTTPTPQPSAKDPHPEPHECWERTQRAQAGAIAEIDCRARRAHLGLPAPRPGVPCVQQTEETVYPGVAGEPPGAG